MHSRASLVLAGLLALAAGAAQATTTIDQNVAMNGSLPGDGAGFPVTITQPGHYRLTGNLTVPPGVNAIVVEAHGVTLDLGGHTISGDVDCQQNTDTLRVVCPNTRPIYDTYNQRLQSGIVIEGDGVVVRDGVVKGFRGHGLVISGNNVRIETVRSWSNQYHGVLAGGPMMHARIVDSGLFLNGGNGVHGGGALIERSTLSKNGGSGARGWSLSIVDSLVVSNGEYGLQGTVTGNPVAVRGSLVYGNKPLSLGPDTLSMGDNFRGNGPF